MASLQIGQEGATSHCISKNLTLAFDALHNTKMTVKLRHVEIYDTL